MNPDSPRILHAYHRLSQIGITPQASKSQFVPGFEIVRIGPYVIPKLTPLQSGLEIPQQPDPLTHVNESREELQILFSKPLRNENVRLGDSSRRRYSVNFGPAVLTVEQDFDR